MAKSPFQIVYILLFAGQSLLLQNIQNVEPNFLLPMIFLPVLLHGQEVVFVYFLCSKLKAGHLFYDINIHFPFCQGIKSMLFSKSQG